MGLGQSFRKLFHKITISSRIWKYRLLSDCANVQGRPRIKQPVLYKGKGKILLHDSVRLGVVASPYLYSGYIYMEARSENSLIMVGARTMMNNNCVILSEGEGIQIGADCLLGYNVHIYDSDFHELTPGRRISGSPQMGRVVIEDDVFIGTNVTILRSVIIGMGSVVAANSLVTSDIPPNVVVAGNPARIIRTF